MHCNDLACLFLDHGFTSLKVYLIETPQSPDQLEAEPDARVLARADGRRVRLVHVVQRLRRALESVVKQQEVVDRVVVVGDEEASEEIRAD